ncbi:hypothetical protein JRO89_XS11G0160800 [Xanthoceras sorbifolium]|uniref:Uncharacterized protein n=1 Tax=Xanthoceras sorbifolium TaxID=99658 RepID=A0ABQ8HFR8_9ROSI|nr:hypothetical protein JRO89_XS11G0160800 [Xanthoceras sorbifolium]
MLVALDPDLGVLSQKGDFLQTEVVGGLRRGRWKRLAREGMVIDSRSDSAAMRGNRMVLIYKDWVLMVRKVRSGTTIAIYKDRWIPRPSTFLVLSPPMLHDCATVYQLKYLSGSWNVGLIRFSFMPMDAEAILSISTSASFVPNLLCWHFENKMVFFD